MKNRQHKETPPLILMFFFIMITITLGFTGILNISDFQKNYMESLISSYEASGRVTANKIENALHRDILPADYHGIPELLADIKNNIPEVQSVRLVSPDHTVMYATDEAAPEQILSPELQELNSFSHETAAGEDFDGDGVGIPHADNGIPHTGNGEAAGSNMEKRVFSYDTHRGDYHIFIPVIDREMNWLGSLQIIFPEEAVASRTKPYSGRLVNYLIVLAGAGMLLLLLLGRIVSYVDHNGNIKRKTFLTISILLLGVIQVIFGGLNYNTFKEGYMDLARNNAHILANIIRKDIESDVGKGVIYDEMFRGLPHLSDYLSEVSESVPEIDAIRLISADEEEVIYSTADNSPNSSLVFSYTLMPDSQNNYNHLQIILSREYFAEKMRDILMDIVTVVVISLILLIEIVFLMVVILQWKCNKKFVLQDSLADGNRPSFGVSIVRFLSMMVGAAVFMSDAFIPLRMKELYEPLSGGSAGGADSIILGLPLTVEMFFAAISAFLAGMMIDKRGWKSTFFLGLSILAMGLFLSFAATQAFLFVLARAFAGAGYGFILIAIWGYVNMSPTEKERNTGFSSFISGIYAGLIIGVVVGAMLADRIGFARVFLVSLVFALLTVPFVLFFLRSYHTGTAETAFGKDGISGFSGIGVLAGMTNMKDLGVYEDTSEESGQIVSELGDEIDALFGDSFSDQPAPDEAKGRARSFLSNYSVLGFFLLILFPLAVCSMYIDYYFPIFAAGQGVSTSNIGRAFMLNGIVIAYLGPVLSNYTHRKFGMKYSVFASGVIISGALLLFYTFGSIEMAYMVVILMGLSESFGLVAQNSYFINLEATQKFGKGAALGYSENIRKLGHMLGPLIFGSSIALGTLGIGLIGALTLILVILFLLSSAVIENRGDSLTLLP